ncbi:unnamed protein product [Miscanthus lutarioriparius]|uniref:Uncharacterized protein n=1 Tax=Miscanthus lutarioriparius TaxID=422564 RepID=A0A811R7Y8_9POAL|nr:unnamed protein product [Miscanthus lutarioriparius]
MVRLYHLSLLLLACLATAAAVAADLPGGKKVTITMSLGLAVQYLLTTLEKQQDYEKASRSEGTTCHQASSAYDQFVTWPAGSFSFPSSRICWRESRWGWHAQWQSGIGDRAFDPFLRRLGAFGVSSFMSCFCYQQVPSRSGSF